MKGRICTAFSRTALLLTILLASVLLDLALGDLSVVPSDATVRKGQSVLFQCAPRDINSDKGITWTAYYTNPTVKIQKIFVVQPGQSQEFFYISGADQNKFVRNDTYNLIVRNVDLTDGVVYSCETFASAPEYANLVVIGDLNIALNPNQNAAVGTPLTITCTLTYGAPNDSNSYKPLTTDQDPKLKIYVGGRDVNAPVYKQPNGIKTAVFNTTVTQDFIGADITCEVESIIGTQIYRDTSTTSLSVPTPPRNMNISVNSNSTDLNNLREGDSVNCSASGFPLPIVRWESVSPKLSNPAASNYGPGWALLILTTPHDNQKWNCTATSSESPGIQLVNTYTFSVKTLTGQSVTGGAPSIRRDGIVCYSVLIVLLIGNLLDKLRTGSL